LSEEELLKLLRDVESQHSERKATLSDATAVRKTICAFANDLQQWGTAGVIFIGVHDNGNCANTPITDELLRTIADMRSDGNILPLPRLDVERRVLNGCEVAVIMVHPAKDPPVRYKSTVWVRVAGSNRVASDADLRVLTEKRRAHDLPFDLRPLSSARVEDLDLEWFTREYLPAAVGEAELQTNDRAGDARLASVRFVSPPPEYLPTVMGLLVSGNEPTAYVPGAYVQFLRLDGLELSDPIKDQKTFTGKISELISDLEETLKAHISIATDIASHTREIQHPEYPFAALQQIVRNAVLHRTYEMTNAPTRITWFNDRIEIQNPGGPFGQVTPENFGSPGLTDYRNPHVAEAMRVLGYVQRFGLGLEIARREMRKNENPAPEFFVDASNVLVTLRRRA